MSADNHKTQEELQHTSNWGSKDQRMGNLTLARGKLEKQRKQVCTCPGHGKMDARVWSLASYVTSGRQATSPLQISLSPSLKWVGMDEVPDNVWEPFQLLHCIIRQPQLRNT